MSPLLFLLWPVSTSTVKQQVYTIIKGKPEVHDCNCEAWWTHPWTRKERNCKAKGHVFSISIHTVLLLSLFFAGRVNICHYNGFRCRWARGYIEIQPFVFQHPTQWAGFINWWEDRRGLGPRPPPNTHKSSGISQTLLWSHTVRINFTLDSPAVLKW